MKCPYCGKDAEWVENKAVYGKNYGKSYMIWLCRDCDAYVGCHNNTKEPLGTMANARLRKARIEAHNAIDPLWKSGKVKRNHVYGLLHKMFGKEIHIGNSDLSLCFDIVAKFNKLKGGDNPIK